MRAGLGGQAMAVTGKHLDTLEEKLSNQIAKGISQTKVMCEAAFSRLDAKISNLESSQPSVDRRIAELSGNVKGLSEEVQSQLRSIESFDIRLREWRQGIEEECRKRLAEVEQRMHGSTSAGRRSHTSLEQQQSQINLKLKELELEIGARFQQTDQIFEGLLNLEARLEAVEAVQEDSAVVSSGARLNDVLDASATPTGAFNSSHPQLQDQLTQALEKVELVTAQNLETHARIEEHGVRLSSIRSKLDAHEQMQRSLGDRLQRAESKAEESKSQLRQVDEVSSGLEHALQKAHGLEKILRSTTDHVHEMYRHIFDGEAPVPSPSSGGKPELGPALLSVLQAFVDRFEAFEDELRSRRTSGGSEGSDEFGSKVHGLVEQLRGIVPKMVQQEHVIKEIQAKMKNGFNSTPLIGFDFDCTITVRHYYKCLAWGLAAGNEGAHLHCKFLFDWLRARSFPPKVPQGNHQLDAVVVVTEFLIQALGPAQFSALFREVFLGGEDRIAALTTWLREKKRANVDMAIITAGIASAVSLALQVAVPEWSDFFPPDVVLDISQNRHQVTSITGAKALILRDHRHVSNQILLVDDSLCKDALPDWISTCAGVKPISLPYEGSGLEKKVFQEVDAALAM